MTLKKVYSNRELFAIFSSVVTRDEGHLTTSDVREAIRIRKRGINVANVVGLLNLDDASLKRVLDTVHLAEKVAETRAEVPRLCDL